MRIETHKLEADTVIAVIGRLDSATAPEFEQHCSGLAAAEPGRVLLDCGRLEYLSSAGLRAILCLAKALQPAGGELCLCDLRGMVAEVISLSGFDSLLRVFDNLESLED
jgi:anti-anti-sigma factor